MGAREDPAGDVVSNTWDYANRLTQVEQPLGEVTTVVYGPVTRRADYKRLSREDSAGTLVNRWDADNVLQQTDDLGTLEADYTLAPPQGNLVSQHRDAESRFYHYDGRTHTAKVTDAAEVITDDYVLDAWGNIKAETAGGIETPFAYMGQTQVFREPAMGTGNPSYWARARWLNPASGRWRSEDPPRDDESNLYRYVNNNASNLTDPSGLQAVQSPGVTWLPRQGRVVDPGGPTCHFTQPFLVLFVLLVAVPLQNFSL